MFLYGVWIFDAKLDMFSIIHLLSAFSPFCWKILYFHAIFVLTLVLPLKECLHFLALSRQTIVQSTQSP